MALSASCKSESFDEKSLSENKRLEVAGELPIGGGQRGKKRCKNPECFKLVPIHCSRCPECKAYEFPMNHKPKKIREVSYGSTVFSDLRVVDPGTI